jgi:hypothetical protein
MMALGSCFGASCLSNPSYSAPRLLLGSGFLRFPGTALLLVLATSALEPPAAASPVALVRRLAGGALLALPAAGAGCCTAALPLR